MILVYRLAAVLLLAGLSLPARAIELPGPLVGTEWLAENREQVLVLDVRNDPDSYRDGGHIIGAVRVDFGQLRGKAMEEGVELEGMSIAADAFEKAMQAAGLDAGEPVVITHRSRGPDDAGYATYLYWQLKYYGHDNVAILDGGTSKWIAENREVWGEEETAEPGGFKVAAPRPELLIDTAAVKRMMEEKSGDILDARSFGFFVGLDKRDNIPAAGHIPGATLFSFDANFRPDGTFRDREALARAAADVGLAPERPVAAYCNTGHVSSISWFVLHELLGYSQARLYDGSMLAWARHDLPAETKLR